MLEQAQVGGTKIFDTSNAIQLSTSNFNEHRKAIIRYTIETNLVASIASFSSSKASSFVMPEISEDDWEVIENDICAISFLQGMSIGTKKYNGYAVVANTLSDDYVDENDIYILGQNPTTGNYVYCKANDAELLSGGSTSILSKGDYVVDTGGVDDTQITYYPGIWKINFETKQDVSTGDTCYYIPMSYKKSATTTGMLSYFGSYTSIYGSYSVNVISTSTDMYRYIHETKDADLKEAYYYGLARERHGSFNINNINYELYGDNDADLFFFHDYEVEIID